MTRTKRGSHYIKIAITIEHPISNPGLGGVFTHFVAELRINIFTI